MVCILQVGKVVPMIFTALHNVFSNTCRDMQLIITVPLHVKVMLENIMVVQEGVIIHQHYHTGMVSSPFLVVITYIRINVCIS